MKAIFASTLEKKMLYQCKGTLLFLFPVGICYTSVNTKVVYSSFHSENCINVVDLEEK